MATVHHPYLIAATTAVRGSLPSPTTRHKTDDGSYSSWSMSNPTDDDDDDAPSAVRFANEAFAAFIVASDDVMSLLFVNRGASIGYRDARGRNSSMYWNLGMTIVFNLGFVFEDAI